MSCVWSDLFLVFLLLSLLLKGSQQFLSLASLLLLIFFLFSGFSGLQLLLLGPLGGYLPLELLLGQERLVRQCFNASVGLFIDIILRTCLLPSTSRSLDYSSAKVCVHQWTTSIHCTQADFPIKYQHFSNSRGLMSMSVNFALCKGSQRVSMDFTFKHDENTKS